MKLAAVSFSQAGASRSFLHGSSSFNRLPPVASFSARRVRAFSSISLLGILSNTLSATCFISLHGFLFNLGLWLGFSFQYSNEFTSYSSSTPCFWKFVFLIEMGLAIRERVFLIGIVTLCIPVIIIFLLIFCF